MNREHPKSIEFSQVLDKACGLMADLGLEREAMVRLADELACMLSNDSFKRRPTVPHSQALYSLMVALKAYLRDGAHPLAIEIQKFCSGLSALPTETVVPRS